MAALTRDDVLAIARLARLHLEPDEVERLRGELSAILEHMERLREVDTGGVEPGGVEPGGVEPGGVEPGGVEPMTHAVPMHLRLRPDEPAAPLSVEEAVGQAPDRAGDLFQVPHILKTAGLGEGGR